MLKITQKSLTICICVISLLIAVGPEKAISVQKVRLDRVILGSPGGRDTMAGVSNEMALKQGFYAKEGLDTEIVLMKGTTVDMATVSGSIDYASKAASTIILAAQGVPEKLLMVTLAVRSTYLISKPEIKSIQNLKGKVIGVGSIGDTEYIFTKMVLAKYGLDPEKDVTFMGVSSALKRAGLFSGTLDTIYGTLTEMLMSKKRGFNALIKVSDHVPPSIAQGLTCNTKKLKENPRQVKKMIRATLKGMFFSRDNREKVLGFWIKDYGYTRDVAEATYDSDAGYFTKNGLVDDKTIEQYYDLSKNAGVKMRPDIPVSQTYDFTLVKEVAKELGI